jgi:hypothetical protein
MLGQIKKYAPFAAIAGYGVVYMNKGYDRILVDIQNITPEKLMAKWQNFAVAAIAIVAVGFVQKAKIPPMVKTLVIIGLYFIAGHQVGTAIDPPYNGGGVVAPSANRYANGGR